LFSFRLFLGVSIRYRKEFAINFGRRLNALFPSVYFAIDKLLTMIRISNADDAY